MEKVVVTKKLANSINWMTGNVRANEFVIKDYVSWCGKSAKEVNEAILSEEFKMILRCMTLDELCRALYVGFKVELTPEEKVQQRFNHLKNDGKRQQMDDILFVLNAYGIRIKGVNA